MKHERKDHIVVMSIATGAIVYEGSNEAEAAMRLKPGTTFGTGWSEKGAMNVANQNRTFHLANGYADVPITNA